MPRKQRHPLLYLRRLPCGECHNKRLGTQGWFHHPGRLKKDNIQAQEPCAQQGWFHHPGRLKRVVSPPRATDRNNVTLPGRLKEPPTQGSNACAILLGILGGFTTPVSGAFLKRRNALYKRPQRRSASSAASLLSNAAIKQFL